MLPALNEKEEPVPEEERAGPQLEVFPPKLEFVADVNKRHNQQLCLTNTGSSVLFYEWKLLSNSIEHHVEEAILPLDATQRFFCHEEKGTLLPGQEKTATFSFSSELPGGLEEFWSKQCYFMIYFEHLPNYHKTIEFWNIGIPKIVLFYGIF